MCVTHGQYGKLSKVATSSLEGRLSSTLQMPIKSPLSSLREQDVCLKDVVRIIGRSISTAKRYELFPFLSLVDEARKVNNSFGLEFKVAVTLSPKLSHESCTLYPVEGIWDLFFCFLEREDGVSLGVCHRYCCGSVFQITELTI